MHICYCSVHNIYLFIIPNLAITAVSYASVGVDKLLGQTINKEADNDNWDGSYADIDA